MRRVSIVIWLLLVCSVQAEVKLTGPNEPIETREPVDLVVEGIDNDDLMQTRVVYWPRENVRVRPILLWGGGNLLPAIEFYAKNPGKYLVSVITPTAEGLGYAEVVIQVVSGVKPEVEHVHNPNPKAPKADVITGINTFDFSPPSPTHKSVLIIEETESRSSSQSEVMQGLASYLDDVGHDLRIVDKGSKDSKTDETPVWLGECLDLVDKRNLNLPVIIVSVPKGDGNTKVVWIEEMPILISKAIEVVDNYGG